MVGCGPLFCGVSHAVSGADWTFTESKQHAAENSETHSKGREVPHVLGATWI